MKELVGLNVKVVLNSSYGIISTVGKFIKLDGDFILVDTKEGPNYIPVSNIKIIKIVKDDDQDDE